MSAETPAYTAIVDGAKELDDTPAEAPAGALAETAIEDDGEMRDASPAKASA